MRDWEIEKGFLQKELLNNLSIYVAPLGSYHIVLFSTVRNIYLFIDITHLPFTQTLFAHFVNRERLCCITIKIRPLSRSSTFHAPGSVYLFRVSFSSTFPLCISLIRGLAIEDLSANGVVEGVCCPRQLPRLTSWSSKKYASSRLTFKHMDKILLVILIVAKYRNDGPFLALDIIFFGRGFIPMCLSSE